ncbi:hypothetical protein WN73_15305 [Bradyrhizobium sp. CCBAU 45394]|nr:hypothetical protein [Bradyrhizobium sp. CCBAU 45394]
MSSPQEGSADHAPIAYDCRFEHTARGNNSERDEAALYKIDVLGRPFWLLQNHPFFQGDRLEALPYCHKLLDRKTRQDYVLHKGPLRGTHRKRTLMLRSCAGQLLESTILRAVKHFEDGGHAVGHGPSPGRRLLLACA